MRFPQSAQAGQRWGDLRVRVMSSVILGVSGLIFIAVGGVWFQICAVFVTAVMIWELAMMIHGERDNTRGMLLAAGVASVISGLLSTSQDLYHMLVLALPAVVGALMMPKERVTFFVFALAISVAGWGLIGFRQEYGALWLFWLVGVVILTDVGGYFGGRLIGGPKFWPSVSPKKTWAGCITGWVLSAAIGAIVMAETAAGAWLIAMSVLVSVASQMGDMAESALKRRMQVKDSSTLLPGHGGLFDRFDGLLGASITLLFISVVMDIPRIPA